MWIQEDPGVLPNLPKMHPDHHYRQGVTHMHITWSFGFLLLSVLTRLSPEPCHAMPSIIRSKRVKDSWHLFPESLLGKPWRCDAQIFLLVALGNPWAARPGSYTGGLFHSRKKIIQNHWEGDLYIQSHRRKSIACTMTDYDYDCKNQATVQKVGQAWLNEVGLLPKPRSFQSMRRIPKPWCVIMLTGVKTISLKSFLWPITRKGHSFVWVPLLRIFAPGSNEVIALLHLYWFLPSLTKFYHSCHFQTLLPITPFFYQLLQLCYCWHVANVNGLFPPMRPLKLEISWRSCRLSAELKLSTASGSYRCWSHTSTWIHLVREWQEQACFDFAKWCMYLFFWHGSWIHRTFWKLKGQSFFWLHLTEVEEKM